MLLQIFLFLGSNTHNNGNPAGDGQAGDDGQGQGGNRILVACFIEVLLQWYLKCGCYR